MIYKGLRRKYIKPVIRLGNKLFFKKKLIKPSFAIAGVQKAGTSSLWHYLSIHPNILTTSVKEINYFFLDNLYDPQNYDSYHSYFTFYKVKENSISFDASNDYFTYPNVPERLFKYNPALKLIFVLRDPVKRAFSAWNMYRSLLTKNRNAVVDFMRIRDPEYDVIFDIYRTDNEINSFNLAIKHEIEAINLNKSIELPLLDNGLYAKHLKNYFKFFPQDQVKIFTTDELKHAPRQTFDRITGFLDISKVKIPQKKLSQKRNVGEYHVSLDKATIELLKEYYKKSNIELEKLLNREFNW